MRTDDQRIHDLEAQAKDLRKRLDVIDPKAENAAGDAAKLSNAISQTEHMLTGIQHLKLQREKLRPAGDGALDKLTDSEIDAKALDVVSSLAAAREKRKRREP